MRHEDETQSQEVNQVEARATRREEEENQQLSTPPQHRMIAVVFPEEAKDQVTGFPLSLPHFLQKQGAGARRGVLVPTGLFSG